MLVDKELFPIVGFGTFQIDDQLILNDLIETALKNECCAFDTAPSYHTEEKLGLALKNAMNNLNINRNEVFISSKIDGWQMQKTNGEIDQYVYDTLNKLNLEYIDVMFIHWPFPEYLQNTMLSLNRLKEKGLIKYIGICNVNKRVLSQYLNNGGIVPDIIQNEISPLNTMSEDIQYFLDLNIHIQAYSPLCRMNKKIRESEILINLSKKYDVSIAKIILKWHIQNNICPIFSTHKVSRIAGNIDLFNFELTSDEIQQISSMNENYKVFVESFGCPGY